MRFLVRRMEEADLPSVLAWRNAPEVRRYMWTRHEISIKEHRDWFGRASRDQNRHLLIFEADSIPSGFIQFSGIGSGRIADWGFYRAPTAPRGSGHPMGSTALAYAFGTLDLHKVCGQAVVENEASRKFHLSHGFIEEGVLRDQFHDGNRYHDVVAFGLLNCDWIARTRSHE